MGLQEQLYGTEAKGSYGDIPHDKANGRYLFRILEVVKENTRKGGFVVVTNKQVVAVIDPGDGKLREGDVVKEMISSQSESALSQIKRWMGKLFGFGTDEEINRELSVPGIRWADPIEVKGNSFAADMVIDQTLLVERVPKKIKGVESYDAKGNQIMSEFTRRTLHGIVPAGNIPQQALRFFPNGPRESRGLKPHEVLPAPVAAPVAPVQPQYQPQPQQYQPQPQQYQPRPQFQPQYAPPTPPVLPQQAQAAPVPPQQ